MGVLVIFISYSFLKNKRPTTNTNESHMSPIPFISDVFYAG